MIKNILIIGPFSPPITGNSLANDVIFKGLHQHDSFKVDTINIQFETFDNNIGSFSIRKVLFYFIKYFGLYKIISTDIVYITPGQTFFGVLKYAPFMYFSKLLKKKIIIHIHGNYLKTQFELLTGYKKKIFYNILKKADKGIVLSESLIENLIPFFSLDKIYIVPNFVEDFFKPENFEIKKTETLKIVYLSNLIEQKGVLDLMNALKILDENEIKHEAKFAGNIEPSLEVKLQPFFNLKVVNYLGIVEGVTKKELLEWSNVFILPTYYKMEGVPISILEAMANGNIIITTKHAGIIDIVSEKNGLFVEPNSPIQIADHLRHINSDISKFDKMRKYNFNNSQLFTEKKFIENLVKVFIN